VNDHKTSQPKIRDRLAGQHILVTGSTGFLAKAFVEKLLRSVDTIGGIHLLVRCRSDGTSARRRVEREVFGSHAFDRLRASLGERFSALCKEKIHVVTGDLTRERLGLDPDQYRHLAGEITMVVNSAATVTFDERIDLAVDLNALGPSRLLQFAKDAGDIPFMHVSTCYVSGVRKGTVIEDYSAPEPAPESLPRVSEGGAYDLDGLIETMQGEANELRHRFGADTDACRRQLIDAGMDRARSLGWNDTYTFTKWIGEQLLLRDRGNVSLVIFRPAIIESSFEEPAPGWIDGLRMADPIIIAYGRGKIDEFPALGDVALDLIPVDFVANAMIATLPEDKPNGDATPVYHCASSDRNPLLLEEMRAALVAAFRRLPMSDDKGRPIHPKRLGLAEKQAFVDGWQGKKRRVLLIQKFFHAVGIRGKPYRRLSATIRQIEQLIYFAKIYAPYTHLDCRFSDDAMRAAGERLHPDDRTMFPFDASRVDWRDYLVNRHIPGIRSYVLGAQGEPTPRILGMGDRESTPAPTTDQTLDGTNLFDVFQRVAERFGSKPALQVRRKGGRWIRYTYADALRATGLIARRFAERGLKPGDRVAICGENSPEWGLTYLAIMRSGMTAVPLDPQLIPRDAWASARFAEIKLFCGAPGTMPGLSEARQADDVELVNMRDPFVPKPAASRDEMAEPYPVGADTVASILFTSGTTVSPKAVQLTHGNLIANAKALVQVHPLTPADELLSVLPMYHAFEFTGGFLVPLGCGATITYVEQLKGPEILAAMQATGTTVMLVVPRLLRSFHNSITATVASSSLFTRAVFRLFGALSRLTSGKLGRTLFAKVHRRFGGRLRMFVSGGSRLDPRLYTAFTKMGFSIYEGYGLTETSPVLTVNPASAARPGSVGPPLPGIKIEIRHRNLDGVGEVWAQGATVMTGYLKNPQATADVLVDGWFRTGDLGRLEENGYLLITGRTTDLIVSGAGKNVYPDDVEAQYRDLPFVKELCVFGLPAEDGLGDTVHAVVVYKEGATTDQDRSSRERQIRAAVEATSAAIPSHQRIAKLHFWDRELPKTSTLKAKRSVIREIVLSERPGSRGPLGLTKSTANEPEPDDHIDKTTPPGFPKVCQILSQASTKSADGIAPSMHLHLDLGIDSIGKMDVLASIESQFGVQITGELAAKIARVSDLLTVIGDREPKDGVVRKTPTFAERTSRDKAATALSNGSLPAPLVPMRWLVRGGVAALMNSYVRVRTRGREHVPSTGAFILAPNHSSHLDSPSIITAIAGKRRVWVAGAEDYFFDTPLKRLIFGRLLDTIPFDRHGDGIEGLLRCGEALRRGDGLLIFPEGTRSTTGSLQPFKVGVAVLAVQYEVPIIPVFIDQAYALWPKGQRLARPGTLTVTFGTPIKPPQIDSALDRHAELTKLTKHVESQVASLTNGANL
jgi:long-chain acyl-CoA synthetase